MQLDLLTAAVGRRRLSAVKAWTRLIRGILPAVLVVGLIARSTPAQTLPDSALGFDLTAFRLVVAFDDIPTQGFVLQGLNPSSGTYQLVGTTSGSDRETSFTLSRSFLATDGSFRLRLSPPPTQSAWIFLLPKPVPDSAPPTDPEVMKRSAIAYGRLPSGMTVNGAWGYVRIDQNSHLVVPTYGPNGDLTTFSMDGEAWPGLRGTTSATGQLTLQSAVSSGSSTDFTYLHDGVNSLRLTVAARGDRLRYTFRYDVGKSIDHAVCVCTTFDLPGKFSQVESLRTSPTPSTVVQDPDTPMVMSTWPFVAARTVDGRYLGILDNNASNLVYRLNRSAGTVSVESWLWPRSVGRYYLWTFEVDAGYENYYGAFLRALNPWTKYLNTSMQGGMGTRYVLDSPAQAQQAYADGVRFIWLHGWFYRNGLYFVAGQPMDQTYRSIWGDTYSYQRLKDQVDNGHAAGLKVFVYIQFVGISEDVTSQFAPSIVKDENGLQVVAGSDGEPGGQPIRNILANGNPDKPYGRSLIDQVGRLLDVIAPDGIALDRTDRLHQTRHLGPGGSILHELVSDYGAFDGYASPPLWTGSTDPRPVSSITYQGVRLFQALRRTLNARHDLLLSNVPIVPYFFQRSDGVKTDQPLTPLVLFFMRASANGRTYFVQDRTQYSGATPQSKGLDNIFLARLVRSQPFLADSASDTQYAQFHETIPNSRLQYVIPTSAGYPDLWLFADGTAVVQFDPAGATTMDKYVGSQFVPWGPVP